MGKSTNDTPETILVSISNLLDCEVRFRDDPSDARRVAPAIDVTGILSKLMALMVFVGWGVPVNIMPAYNRVHADVEFWKKKFESSDEPNSEANIPPDQGEPPPPAG